MCKTSISRVKQTAAETKRYDLSLICGSIRTKKDGRVTMMIMNKIALAIAIIGTLNWGLVGLFSFDLVAWISGGPETVLARIIYIAVALAGIWCISLLFRDEEEEIGSHA